MQKIVIIGGHGNGTVIASTIEDCFTSGQKIKCVGFLNDYNDNIDGYPVLGKINNNAWKKIDSEYFFVYAMSTVKHAHERYKMLKQLSIPKERFAKIIHPTAVVSKSAKIGAGAVLMPYTVVGPNVIISCHTQMFAQSFVGHDAVLNEMVFVANNATIGGNVEIDTGSHIGSNSSVIERVKIGAFSIIGLGSVVIKDVQPFTIVVGNPARFVRIIEG